MLRPVALAEDFRLLVGELPDNWTDARLALRLRDEEEAARAAALLSTLSPGRHRETVRFYTARRGAGHGPDFVAGVLRRLDDEGIHGELELVSAGEAPTVAETSRATLAASWDAALTGLPPDWSDILAEVELHSTDYLERAALMMSPLNPARHGGRPGFRFRCARSFGYGAAPEMVRRCLERLDEQGISGEVRVLRALSGTEPWGTQGPVWYVAGKVV